MKIKILTIFLAAFLSTINMQASANTTTLTFNALNNPGEGFTSISGGDPANPNTSVYTENGFVFSTGAMGWGSAKTGDVAPAFIYHGVPMTWYYGSTSMFNDDLSGANWTTVRNVAGSAFNFNSIDLAAINNYYTFTVDGRQSSASGINVEFVGTVHGGGTVDTIVHISDQFNFRTFNFTNFDNLDSLAYNVKFPPGQGGVGFQFDNLVFSSPGRVSLPEPASMALLGLGLVGLVLGRRKL